ncbi:glycerophosphodiester phosphodiesterase [Nocardioides iriomotensis]|nr:glycerophosphodiester phosphodiesterase [Nocardioides iriomotensis]
MSRLGKILTQGAVLMAAVLTTSTVLAPAGSAAPGHASGTPGVAPRMTEPLVIAHRGASGYRPEHTLAAYRLAIQMGADYIEPDLVSTKDGVLVARHENEIGGTTDVAEHPEFADRRTTKTIDGRPVTGWFTEDFTLDELRTLRAKERLPQVRPGNTRYDGRFQVPTFDEVLRLAREESKRRGTTIGVYPETKHPTYFDSIGLSLEEPLLRSLRAANLDKAKSPVIIQSFETANLKDLATRTKVTLAQLVDVSGAPYDTVAAGDPTPYSELVTAEGLREIATYADGLGAHKDWVLPRDATGATTGQSAVVDDAHAAGLVVHVWTMRDENQFMATDFRRGTDPNAKGDARAEIHAFLDAGVDGVFSDFADTAVDARDLWLAERAGRAG